MGHTGIGSSDFEEKQRFGFPSFFPLPPEQNLQSQDDFWVLIALIQGQQSKEVAQMVFAPSPEPSRAHPARDRAAGMCRANIKAHISSLCFMLYVHAFHNPLSCSK